jgi:uncharacterized C2H2 Zn-finger protein
MALPGTFDRATRPGCASGTAGRPAMIYRWRQEIVLDRDSIALLACPRCPALGFVSGDRGGIFFRCPDCKSLCTVGRRIGPEGPLVTSRDVQR